MSDSRRSGCRLIAIAECMKLSTLATLTALRHVLDASATRRPRPPLSRVTHGGERRPVTV